MFKMQLGWWWFGSKFTLFIIQSHNEFTRAQFSQCYFPRKAVRQFTGTATTRLVHLNDLVEVTLRYLLTEQFDTDSHK